MLRPENMMHAALLLTLPTWFPTVGLTFTAPGDCAAHMASGHHDATNMAAAYQLARTPDVPRVDVSEVF